MEERELNEFASEIQDKGIRQMFVFLIRGFTGIKDELKELKSSVDKLQTITIIQENGKQIEHIFQRNAFFQKIYDEIEEIKRSNENRTKTTLTKLSEWSKILYPIIIILAVVLTILGYTDLANKINNLPH